MTIYGAFQVPTEWTICRRERVGTKGEWKTNRKLHEHTNLSLLWKRYCNIWKKFFVYKIACVNGSNSNKKGNNPKFSLPYMCTIMPDLTVIIWKPHDEHTDIWSRWILYLSGNKSFYRNYRSPQSNQLVISFKTVHYTKVTNINSQIFKLYLRRTLQTVLKDTHESQQCTRTLIHL